jgi:hypothetical protein
MVIVQVVQVRLLWDKLLGKRNKKVAIKPLPLMLTVLPLDIYSPTHHSPSLL